MDRSSNQNSEDRFKTGGAIEAMDELSAVEDATGQVIGDYTIEANLGEGGMARVYRAQRSDGEFEKAVAIKLMLNARLTPRQRELAFRERQILAELSHPHIAQLFDAGATSEGIPFLIMELVDGEPIDRFCHERHLTIRQRVSLLMQVAAATGHAHSHLIIHRDIKPSNVMVTNDGVPKLLDFGVAKLVDRDDQDGDPTQALTPGFASPELMLGQSVTIASDVYQLGLLLLHMLVEKPVVEHTWPESILRASEARGVEFEAHTLENMPEDLWQIVSKCLQPDPGQRYTDVNALRADLQRYLNNEPIQARPPTLGYRLSKFVQRHTAPVAVGVLAVLALSVSTFWYLREVTEARSVAEARAETASRVTRTLSTLISETFRELIRASAGENEDGPNQFIRSSLATTAQVVEDQLADEPSARAEALNVQASLQQLLGNLDEAESLWREASTVADPAGQPQLVFDTQIHLANLYQQKNDPDQAEEWLAQAALTSETADLSPDQRLTLLQSQAQLLAVKGDFEASNQAYEKVANRLAEQSELSVLGRLRAYNELSVHNNIQRRMDEAISWADKAIALAQQELPSDSYELIAPHNAAGWAHRSNRDFDQALFHFQQALALARANFGRFNPQVADAHNAMGAINYSQLDMVSAADHFTESLQIAIELFGEKHLNVAGAYSNAATVLLDGGRIDEAINYYETSIGIAREIGDGGARALALALRNMAKTQALIGNWDEAEDLYREAIAFRREVFGPDGQMTLEAMIYFSGFLSGRERHDEAGTLFDEAMTGLRKDTEPDDFGVLSWSRYGWPVELARGNTPEARELLELLIKDSGEARDYGYIEDTKLATQLAELCMGIDDLSCAGDALEQAKLGMSSAPNHPYSFYRDTVNVTYLERTERSAEADTQRRTLVDKLRSSYPGRDDLLTRLGAGGD
ncbi:MAG: tetratricopeptide repeat protein [Pseudomonadota bacterium]